MRPRPSFLLVCVLAAAGACSDPEPPSWRSRHVRLAEGFEPAFELENRRYWGPPVGRDEELFLHPGEEGGVWVETSIPSAAWIARETPGLWVTGRLMPGMGSPMDGSPGQRLVVADAELQHVSFEDARAGRVDPGSFCAAGSTVYLYTDGPRPPDATLFEYLDLGRDTEGVWRMRVKRFTTDGIPVLPGYRETVTRVLPAQAMLRFSTLGVTYARGESDPAGTIVFRILEDGEVRFEHEQEIGLEVRPELHEVELAGEGRTRLTFEVEGGAAFSAFLAPIVGPRSIGDYGRRPWDEERPNVVVFLADTFRADNMALYGGDPRLTPKLDLFAEDCVRFERAWSTSTWTLPTHAAMFSGLFPHQSGVRSDLDALPLEASTIAERLADAGYRTCAVTDGAFVSSSYGLDQGFEWFDEEWTDVESTLARARSFLEADDGRPVFLFVQTYRVHTPYVVSEGVRRRLGRHLDLPDQEFFALVDAGPELELGLDPSYVPTPEEERQRSAFHALYRGAVADLDDAFETFRLDLLRRNVLEDGVLVFTSDHGEGFWEHQSGGHGRSLWEEHVRVPLLIHGSGLEPRTVSHAATSIDLPRTLAALAGIEPAPDWEGRDLLTLDEDRPAVLFQCPTTSDREDFALVDGARKLIAPAELAAIEAREVSYAYDLDADPLERASSADGDWPRRLLEELTPRILGAWDPRLESSDVRLDAEQIQRMRALGYFGGDR